MALRTIIYIDGFNLYYGALSRGQYKWLNLDRYFSLLRPHDDIQRVYYFTALISGNYKRNQSTYLRALATLPRVEVVLGKFKSKTVRCGVRACNYKGRRSFEVPEEKRTDVNIAMQLLGDAYQDNYDQAVIVSGDSDLVPVVLRARERFPEKKTIVYIPSRDPVRGAAIELRTSADKHKTLPLNLLRHAQFPRQVPDGRGNMIEKPMDW